MLGSQFSASSPLPPDETGRASSVPHHEDAPFSRMRTLTFASGHVIYGSERAIDFVNAMLNLYDREALMLRRKVDELRRANAADDAAEIARAGTPYEVST